MMLISILSDLHITDRTPRSRSDDYPKTQFEKIRDTLQKIREVWGSKLLVIPGDIFDSSRVPDVVKKSYIKLLREEAPLIDILVVFGQHDLRYHSLSTMDNTPLALLEEACENVHILGKTPKTYMDKTSKTMVNFHGYHYGEEIKNVERKEGVYNVLVAHRMVLNGDEQFIPGTPSNTMFRLFPSYDLILTGDNHQSFSKVSSHGGVVNTLVNAGSLMRMTSAQKEHAPTLFLHNTNSRNTYKDKLIVPPASDVFLKNEEEIQRETQAERFDKLIELLEAQRSTFNSMNIEDNLLEFIKQESIPEATASIIKELMTHAKGHSSNHLSS